MGWAGWRLAAALAMASAVPVAGSAEEVHLAPGEDPVIPALDPLIAHVPQRDVMGLRLGMGWREVRAIMVENDFRGGDISVTGSGSGTLRYARFDRAGRSLPANDMFYAVFSGSSKPRLVAVFRHTAYRQGAEVTFNALEAALKEKYGEPTYDIQRGRDEFLYDWIEDGTPKKCRAARHDMGSLRIGNVAHRYDGCYRGVTVSITPHVTKPGWPVRETETILVDSDLIKANNAALQGLAIERENERRRQEGERLRGARPADL